MTNYISRAEADELCDELIRQFMGDTDHELCVDIDCFVTHYLRCPVVYENFAEDDPDKIGFASDGVQPLRVRTNGRTLEQVYPQRTIVLDRVLLNPGEEYRRRFTIGALSTIFLLILYKGSKETAAAADKPDDGLPFMDALGKLFHNKYWVIVLVANLFVNVIYALSSSSGTYYAKYILGDDNLVGIMGAVGLIPTVIGFAVVGPMTNKLGLRKTLLVAFGLGIVGNTIRCFAPDSFMLCITVGLLGSFATIPMMCVGGTLTSMAIDYNDYKYGNKIVGMSASASSFGSKVASGLGASLVGWINGMTGFVGNMEVVTPAVRYGIYTFSIYIPLAMLVGLFFMIRKFDLEATYGEMMQTINARKAAEKTVQ